MEELARELVRALRGSRSQPAFSRRLGYRSNVAYSWESGRRFPTGAELLRAAARVGVDVPGAVARFYRTPPPWLAGVDVTTPLGVATLLDDLRGNTPIHVLATRTGRSRHAISRWLDGRAEPRLPDFLRLVEAASVRLLDFCATLVDVTALPSARSAWAKLEAQRRAAYEVPWTQAVLRAIELAPYRALPEHVPGWIAARLGIPAEEEERALGVLAESGQVRWADGRWAIQGPPAVDTRRDAAAGRRLKGWWARVGIEALEGGSEGQFSYNVFSVSEEDFARLRELHAAYFRQLRAVVAASSPGERVVVANVQLFALDPGVGGRPIAESGVAGAPTPLPGRR